MAVELRGSVRLTKLGAIAVPFSSDSLAAAAVVPEGAARIAGIPPGAVAGVNATQQWFGPAGARQDEHATEHAHGEQGALAQSAKKLPPRNIGRSALGKLFESLQHGTPLFH
jgi:hypothetical protein